MKTAAWAPWAAAGSACRWPQIALLGIGQFALLIALLNIGLQTLPAAKAALLFACFPLLTLLVATALGHERLSLRKSLGVAFTLGGVALALGPQPLVADAPLWGELAVPGSALCGAVCSVLYRSVLRRHAALPVSAIAMAAAVLFLVLWALRHAPASKVTLYLSLSPLTALLLGSLLLHEPPAPALIVALLLVVLGLWVAQDRRP